jgi:MATE family multidrug resistance protein
MSAPASATTLAFPPRRPLAAEIGACALLAWPMIATNFTTAGMMATDVAMLGWLSPEALAAGSVGFNFYFPIYLFCLGIVAVASPLAAHARGRDRSDLVGVRRITQQALFAAVIFALPFWALLWFAGPLLSFIGEPMALAHGAGVYVHGVEWALLPALGMVALRGTFAALDRVFPALVAGAVALIVNAALDYGLIFGKAGLPALGVFGSGLATTLSHAIMFLVLVAFAIFDRELAAYGIFSHLPRWDWPTLKKLLRLGLPSGFLVLSEVGMFAGSYMIMGFLGMASVEAHAAVLQIASLAFSVPLGLGQAAAVRVGQNFGARNAAGVKRAGSAAVLLTVCFATCSALFMISQPSLLLGLFFDFRSPDAAEAIALGFQLLWVAAAFQLFDGLQVILTSVLRGAQDVRVPLILALIGFWGIGAPLGLALGFLTPLKALGVWIGLASGLAAVTCLEGLRWRRIVAKMARTLGAPVSENSAPPASPA